MALMLLLGESVLRFAAIDIETANSDISSICALGLAIFDGAGVIHEWYSLVNPGTHFDGMNISIHGIRPVDVINAPNLYDVASRIWRSLDSAVVVTHTHFDRSSIQKVSATFDISAPKCQWLDSATVARRTWPSIAERGYGLENDCKIIGYNFNHHHALEDAKAAGQIILASMRESGRSLSETIELAAKLSKGKSTFYRGRVSQHGNPSGKWDGKTIVFTGELSMARNEAAKLASSVGFHVADSITKMTTFLVVGGVKSESELAGITSSKLKKAELLRDGGQQIYIVTEDEFQQILAE